MTSYEPAERPEPGRSTHSAADPHTVPAQGDLPAAAGRPALPTVWEQMGGVSGMFDSGLPVVVFVIANAIGGLTAGIVAAIVAGLAIFVFRLVRKNPVTQAVGGLLAVGVAAFIAARSGSAGGFFKLGIWSYLLYGGLLLISLVVRWPAIGLIWEGINGHGTGWRQDRAKMRRYDLATVVWVLIFASRYLVQNALLGREEIGWLAFTKIAMGYPLYIFGILASVWIVLHGSGTKMPSLRSVLGGPNKPVGDS